MNRIESLIEQYCQDGVEFKELWEVAKISNGKDHKHLEDGNVPVYGSGGIMRYANRFIYNKESVLIPRKGSIGNIFYVSEPFWTVDTIFYTKITKGYVSPKFLYYYLKTLDLTELNFAGGVPSLTKTILDKISIPIPPLPVQEEIVNILDKFTSLEAELEAELEARQTQYDYYRNQLLSFEGKDVEWKTLGEIGKFTRGRRFVKNDMISEGVPCIHYGEMYTFYHISADDTISYLEPGLAAKLRVANPGDVIIVAAGETVEDLGKGVAWLGDRPVVFHDACFAFAHNQNPLYISHFLQTEIFRSQIKKFVSSGKISSIHALGLSKALIPIPPLPEQERIVEILDKFDALVNDISEGLPAEIQARRKQYEYYRNKLLTFKPLVN
jgi:type I restriction enzyme S subunit